MSFPWLGNNPLHEYRFVRLFVSVRERERCKKATVRHAALSESVESVNELLDS